VELAFIFAESLNGERSDYIAAMQHILDSQIVYGFDQLLDVGHIVVAVGYYRYLQYILPCMVVS
jgi:hypothetical protein